MIQPVILGIDWGTTNFRAYLLSATADIISSRVAAQGILSVEQGSFADTLQQQVGDWLQQYPQLPVLMSGMVGSSLGWHEVGYQTCPVDLSHLSLHLHRLPMIDQHPLFIVPGLNLDISSARADVMRGEETQLFGAVKLDAAACYCLPGTHSKWVAIKQSAIAYFTTYMTGEFYSLLRQHSILQQQMQQDAFDQEVFLQGLQQASHGKGLLADCFNVRAQSLMGQLSAEKTQSYVSGLLIGSEVLSAKDYWGDCNQVTLIASEQITQRYRIALEYLGVTVTSINGERAVTQGLVMLAQQAKII